MGGTCMVLDDGHCVPCMSPSLQHACCMIHAPHIRGTLMLQKSCMELAWYMHVTCTLAVQPARAGYGII